VAQRAAHIGCAWGAMVAAAKMKTITNAVPSLAIGPSRFDESVFHIGASAGPPQVGRNGGSSISAASSSASLSWFGEKASKSRSSISITN
jgi:hypothetical protein